MIQYNNKFLNIATILLIFYILYSAKQQEPRFLANLQASRGNTTSKEISTYNMVLDPQKPDSQKTWPEWIISHFFKDKIHNAIKEKTNYTTINKYGDKITYLYIVNSSNPSDNFNATLDYTIGVTKTPSYVEQKLMNAKQGDVYDLEIKENGANKQIHIEIKEIEKSKL